jgi:basic membrane protein A
MIVKMGFLLGNESNLWLSMVILLGLSSGAFGAALQGPAEDTLSRNPTSNSGGMNSSPEALSLESKGNLSRLIVEPDEDSNVAEKSDVPVALTREGSQEDTSALTRNTIAKPTAAIKVACVFAAGGSAYPWPVVGHWNDMAKAGFDKAIADGIMNEWGFGSAYSEPNEPSEYAGLLEGYAIDGSYDLIVSFSWESEAAVNTVAMSFPSQKIALIDYVVIQGSVRSIIFKDHEGSFLAGAMAGLMTKTGKIGFIGGMDIDFIRAWWAGYAAGAFYERNNSYTEVLENFVGAWDDLTTAKSMAEAMWADGVDVIFAAAGWSGLGVLESANETEGVYAIGDSADLDYLYPGRILCSMMKRYDTAVYSAIKDVYDNNWSSDVQSLGLAENGVGLSPLTYTKDEIGAAKIHEVNVTVRNKIVRGEIVVPYNATTLNQWIVDMGIANKTYTPSGLISTFLGVLVFMVGLLIALGVAIAIVRTPSRR